MSFRPVITTNSLGSNFNNLNDFMRDSDNQVSSYRKRFSTATLLSTSLVKSAGAATGTTTIAHGLAFIPLLVYSIENTTQAPGEWVSGQYMAVDTTSGITNGRAYMTADTVNIYLKATTPSTGTLFATALTFSAKYWVLQTS